MPLRFLIYSPDSIVVVDNSSITTALTGLASNIVAVAFRDDNGSIEYNDRPAMRTPFTDPSPYQALINSWLTASAAATMPLQLAQAKQVKKNLVEAIFHHKRRLPYTQGVWQYDASDESVSNLDLLVQGTAVGVVDSSNLVASINNSIAQINANVNANNRSAAAVNGWSLSNSNNWSRIGWQYGSLVGGAGGNHSYLFSDINFDNVGSNGFESFGVISTVSGGSSAPGLAHLGNITHQPLNATTAQSIPAVDINAALQGIASRRNALNTNRLGKQIAINNLTTIAAVTAYDATTGWSF